VLQRRTQLLRPGLCAQVRQRMCPQVLQHGSELLRSGPDLLQC